ncbi:SusC/RagA family TonB-linked outer membrane protein [Flavobacterium seoulense]|uniref:TonB-linked outer membrane protein n=1 Tax=Flavobacterium seoulense TaxID=1492738 RepID=A0A066WTA2_9FLAO|nr:TonB-dependent receptor [Flavobacterium seoulense]KDN54219.1 TonB-linked outer membrane protein [Flavobacterium seoulense]
MKNKLFYLLSFILVLFLSTTTYAQEKLIKGKIIDESGLPVPGASLVIKGTTKGSTTDMDGNYSISAKPGDVIVFTYLGYKTVEEKVTEANNYNISLVPTQSQLEEVVVVGYGTQKKSDLTGAITRVSAEELNNRPVSNAMEALQGKAAGVDITTNERPGQLGSVRIRGQRSLNASSEPLYVVDGVPLFSSSAIETLNPRDIESIDVLKDASATAIYGSRGANGVIIVTTKQGKSGRFTLNYSATLSTTDIVDRAPSMSAADFIQFKRWAQYNSNPAAPHPNSPTLANDTVLFDSALDGQATRDNVLKGWESGTWDPSKVTNTDWTKFVTQTGIMNEHVISASGGSEKINSYASFGYLSNKGTQRGQDYTRYTTKLSTNITATDWFKLNASLNVSWSEQDFGMSTLGGRSGSVPNAIYGAAKSVFNIATPYDANGNLIINPGGESGVYTIMNEWEKSTQLSQTMRALGNISATFDIGKIWEPLQGLTYKFNFGPDFRHWREGVYIDGTSSHRINSNGTAGRNLARLRNARDFSWTLDNMISYDRTFNKHKIGATLLQTASSWDIENSSISASNIAKSSFLWNALNDIDVTNPNNSVSIGSDLIQRQLTSYMARFNYGFDNRYLLTVSARWDGASQLADGYKWDVFPSAALAWRVDQEEFMKDINWVDNLKFRLGFGTVGNSSVAPYSSKGPIRSILLPFNGLSNQIGYTTNEPYYTNSLISMPNPALGWEKTTQYNLGIDFGFLKNRISGTIELYKSFTNDLLMEVLIPPLTGYPSTIANVGKTSNRGIEATLNFIPVQTESGFTWETNINGAWQKDKIEELAYGKNDMVDNTWFIGQQINVRYGFDNLGIWQNTPEDLAEMAKWNAVATASNPNAYQFTPGSVRPKDQNGDYQMTIEDRTIIGNSNPNWTMGWNNTFNYKGFELSANIYGRMGYTASLGGEALTGTSNQRQVDYWTPDNPNAEFQKPVLGQASAGSRDPYSGLLGFTKASFVKIRNISLGYNFPKDFTSTIGLANLKLYAQAVNPGSIYQSVDWYDFDTNATYFNRSFVMGIEVGF